MYKKGAATKLNSEVDVVEKEWHKEAAPIIARDNILLYGDRVVIPKQLRFTLMDALYLTHTGHRGIVEAANHVWYSYLHRDVVSTAQNCKNCRNKCKNLKAISGKKHYTLLDAVVETNKENRLDFSGPLPNKNRKEI